MNKNIVKILVTFKPIMQFWCPSRFRILGTIPNHYILWKMTKTLTIWPYLTITTFVTRIHTHIKTDGHGDSMTDPLWLSCSLPSILSTSPIKRDFRLQQPKSLLLAREYPEKAVDSSIFNAIEIYRKVAFL